MRPLFERKIVGQGLLCFALLGSFYREYTSNRCFLARGARSWYSDAGVLSLIKPKRRRLRRRRRRRRHRRRRRRQRRKVISLYISIYIFISLYRR